MDLPVSFVFHSSLLAVKCVNLVVARDGFLCITEIACIFFSAYFDYRDAFWTDIHVGNEKKHNGIFTFLIELWCGITRNFHSGYFDNRGAFRAVLDL